MRKYKVIAIAVIGFGFISGGCSEPTDQKKIPANNTYDLTPGVEEKSSTPASAHNYQELFEKIIQGQATLAEVREALTDQDPAALTNTVHALYSMQWHRGVIHVLKDMWAMNKTAYPELAWDLIEKPPVRIALASTLNRIFAGGTPEYKEYIRQHENETHEFNRAQVVVALGFNGDPADVEYLKTMASGDNVYVTQSALTGLAFMNNPQARDALIKLEETFKDDPRSKLAAELLSKAYHWPESENKK